MSKIRKAQDQSDLKLPKKGCNCKKTGCQKNYCDCYQAKIACSSNCKCLECLNNEGRSEMDVTEIASGVATELSYANDNSELTSSPNIPPKLKSPNKQPFNFLTQDLIDSTVQCMMAQAEECQRNDSLRKDTEKKILEEFGGCLANILDFSKENVDN